MNQGMSGHVQWSEQQSGARNKTKSQSQTQEPGKEGAGLERTGAGQEQGVIAAVGVSTEQPLAQCCC